MAITTKLIKDVFSPIKGEMVTLVTDDQPEQKSLISAFCSKFEELGFKVRIIKFKPTRENSAPLPKFGFSTGKKLEILEFLNALGKRDIVLAITKYSATGPIFDRLRQGFRAASMPNAFLGMESFDADYSKMARKAHLLKDMLNRSDNARLEFSTGEVMQFDLRIHRAKADDGICRKPGQGINLPSGEAFIVPYEGKGSKTQGEWPIWHENRTVILKVEENRIVRAEGSLGLTKEFQKYPNTANIAELGLGCNDAAKVIGYILQDEKVEGVHIAYGMSSHLGGTVTPEMMGFPIHEDKIYARGARIFAKRLDLLMGKHEKTIIKQGSYVPGIFR